MAKIGLYGRPKRSGIKVKVGRRKSDMSVNNNRFYDEITRKDIKSHIVYSKKREKKTGYRGEVWYKDNSFRFIKAK